MTGSSWVDRKAQEQANQGMFPDINKRRAPLNDTLHSMGRMTGAAGFKRENVPSKIPDPGLIGFTYRDPNAPPSQRSMAGNS